ncbi:hypothetical protein ACUOA8_53555, partial [Escherichia sp. SS-MK2]
DQWELRMRQMAAIARQPVRKAKHGDSSGVRGAAWLWPQE